MELTRNNLGAAVTARPLFFHGAVVCVWCFGQACVGSIGQGEETSAETPRGGGGDIEAPAAACSETKPLAPRRLWRLSSSQYANAVRDLLHLSTTPTVTGGGVSSVAFFTSDTDGVSAPLAFEYADVGAKAAATAAAQVDKVTGCPAGMAEEACARQFIAGFGARAFRRPLAADEAADLLAVYDEGRRDGFAAGIQLVIEAVAQAPSFIYRTELGTPAGTGRVSLTPYEVAAALSFFFLDSVPDPALWAAAENGRLATEEEIATEVDRLFVDPRVRQNLTRIAMAWLHAGKILDTDKDPMLFPQYTSDLRKSLNKETALFLGDLLWTRRAGVADLLTSPETFVDESLARLYGVTYSGPKSSGAFIHVTLPAEQRAGVLTQAGFLASRSGLAETSVVHRGLFVYDDLLCLPRVPAPPASLGGAIAASKNIPTERGRALARAQDTRCGGCHGQFDPFGLLFERYDPIGRHRVSTGGVPIDATADLSVGPVTGRLDGAVALGRRLASDGTVAACMTNRMLSYALGRELADPGSCAATQARQRAAAAGPGLSEVFRAVANSPVLRVRLADEEVRP